MFKKTSSIKVKLLLQYGLLIVLSVLLMITTLTYIDRILNYQNYRAQALDLKNTILQMRRAEKDFMLRESINENFFKFGKSNYLDAFTSLHPKAVTDLNELRPVAEQSGFDSMQLAYTALLAYKESFEQIVQLSLKRGFKDYGAEGTLRSAIHRVEQDAGPYDTVAMLTLRRHEKDFLLRRDLSYITKFDATLAKFRTRHVNAAMTKAIDEYSAAMAEIVSTEQQLGIGDDGGVKGKMRAAIRLVELIIARVEELVVEQVDTEILRAYIILISLFVVQLVIAGFLAVVFANSLTRSIKAIQERVESLSNGIFPEKIALQSEDEVGVASRSINSLIDRIRTATTFASSIGAGDLTARYDDQFSNDVLAKSLIDMQVKLQLNDEETDKRNWIATRLADFSNLLREDASSTEELAQRVVSSIVKVVGAAQGQIYLVQEFDGQDEVLVLKGTYAWGKSRKLHQQINKGSGITGQVWLEKATQYLTDIPSNYIKITSGLGEALPKSLLIVPLKVNEEVHGVLELSSFTRFEPHQLEFIERIAEVLGSYFASAKINFKTQELLKSTQQQAEELRAQEEEMRQNQEEMQATQEEMNRQRTELEAKIAALTKELLQTRQVEKVY